MKSHIRVVLVASLLGAGALAFAQNSQPASSAEEVVTVFYEHLRTGDVDSLDSLFFRIPVIENNEADWLALLEMVAQKVEDEQLDWEVVCSKELQETAVVIVNQTMKYGKPHGDPDAIYLVREDERWLLLPDVFAPNADDEVRASLSSQYVRDQFALKRWALGEIRGLTSECRS